MKHLRYFLLFMVAFSPFMLNAQHIERLIDSAYIKKVFAEFDRFVGSVDSLRERKENLNVYIIYETYLLDNDIEESIISPKYYLSGRFLEDLEGLQIWQKQTYKPGYGRYFTPGHFLVYDAEADKVYRYHSLTLDKYYYGDQDFYHFIAKLYKNGQIDCAFFYPSVINKPTVYQKHYEQLMYLVFAIKNGEFYVIRDGKDEIKAPAMYSLEDYINCCWDEMIGAER